MAKIDVLVDGDVVRIKSAKRCLSFLFAHQRWGLARALEKKVVKIEVFKDADGNGLRVLDANGLRAVKSMVLLQYGGVK